MMINTAIKSHLAANTNSFGLIRLIAASMVIISHSWIITGGIKVLEPLQALTGFSLGWHAVNIFFALSGLLIAASLERSKFIILFIWARFLRIYPALLIVIFTTLIISALSTNMSNWNISILIKFILKNIFLLGGSATLPGIFENNPIAGEINAPLWTLKYEVLAYASLAGIFVIYKLLPKLPAMKYMSLVILFVTSAIMSDFGDMSSYTAFEHLIRLFFAFYLGVTAWYWQEKIRVKLSIAIILLILNSVFIWAGFYLAALQILTLVYLALLIGVQQYGWLTRFTNSQDYSYGIYIIGYPIQQLLVAFSITLTPATNAVYALLISLALASVLWNLIEKPALKLKKH